MKLEVDNPTADELDIRILLFFEIIRNFVKAQILPYTEESPLRSVDRRAYLVDICIKS